MTSLPVHNQTCPTLLHQLIMKMQHNNTSRVHFTNDSGVPAQMSYAEVSANAHQLADNLRRFGLSPGCRIAIHGNTSIDWFLTDIACMCGHFVSVAIYPNTFFERVLEVVQQADCKLVFTESVDFARRLKQAGYRVILMGVGNLVEGFYSCQYLSSYPVDELPVEYTGTDIIDHEVFTIVSTSGTLSDPRLFGVQYEPLKYTMDQFGQIFDLSADDSFLVFLPISHLPQRMILLGCLERGMNIILSDTRNFIKDAQTFNPTLTVTVPRVLEHILKKITDCAGYPDKPVNIMGSSMRYIFVGSAPTPVDTLEQLLELGYPICEVYGTTELGIISITPPGKVRPGYTGKAITWGDVRLGDDDQILVKTPTPFLYGFLHNQKIEPFNWDPALYYSSGDIGEIDHQYVKVVCRVKDYCALANGEKVFVKRIEETFKRAVPSHECVVIGNGDRYLSALFFPDPEATGLYTEDIEKTIHDHNEGAHILERIVNYSICDELPSVQNNCLTDTMKLRRHKIEEYFKSRVSWIKVSG